LGAWFLTSRGFVKIERNSIGREERDFEILKRGKMVF
jgi:hypothetical protein